MTLDQTWAERRNARIHTMLDRMRAAWIVEGDGIEAQREAFRNVARLFPDPVGVVEQTIEIGGVGAVETTPTGGLPDAAPVILYLHGGAFVIGSADIYREQSARVSTAAGARIITLDYRLAPEHPFPAAVDDTVKAYRGLLDSGIEPERIVVGGDSAGGNLALAASIRLRDAGTPLPAGLVLISPWVNLHCSSDTMETNANPRHLAQRAGLRASAKTYLGAADADSPEASPLYAILAGLPPALIQVGSLETLLDDSLELERRLVAASGSAQLHVYEGMVHEWHLLSALLSPDEPLPDAREAIEEIAGFVYSVTST